MRLTRQQYHLDRIRAYAVAHLHDGELTVAKVGAAVGLSVAHIHRLYASEAQTFIAWLWEVRLQACQSALRRPELVSRTIREIAFEHGFVHATHFSRAFRARFGVTASAWRSGAKT